MNLDTWQWDEDLREAGRLVRSLGYTVSAGMASETDAGGRANGGSGGAAPPAWSPLSFPPRIVERTSRPKRTRTPAHSLIAWLTISAGVTALVFGGVLLGWSWYTGRTELWNLGLPFALGGQAVLIVGLVLQLDGLSQSSQDAVQSISELDERLNELRRVAAQLHTTHSSASQSFYFHLAEGCSPHMLLADLKGQLDLLALRMAEEK